MGVTGACTVFNHSNDQYSDSKYLKGDVMKFNDFIDVSCKRVIVAVPDSEEKFKAQFMVEDSY